MKKIYDTKPLAQTALIAAIYVILSIIFVPFSFGVVQFRIAEALVLLCVLSPNMVSAVTLGCFLANFIGFLMGFNPIALDILFGTLATLIAGILSFKLRNIRFKGYPIIAIVPPIVINAIVIGGEITLLEAGGIFGNLNLYLINAIYIALSETVPCVIGLFLVVALEKTGLAKKYLMG